MAAGVGGPSDAAAPQQLRTVEQLGDLCGQLPADGIGEVTTILAAKHGSERSERYQRACRRPACAESALKVSHTCARTP